jgi:hypothetical protein
MSIVQAFLPKLMPGQHYLASSAHRHRADKLKALSADATHVTHANRPFCEGQSGLTDKVVTMGIKRISGDLNAV